MCQVIGQLASAHLGHHHVSGQWMNGALIRGAEFHGFVAIGSCKHVIAGHLVDFLGQQVDIHIVLHE
jgi:hypothetical protein